MLLLRVLVHELDSVQLHRGHPIKALLVIKELPLLCAYFVMVFEVNLALLVAVQTLLTPILLWELLLDVLYYLETLHALPLVPLQSKGTHFAATNRASSHDHILLIIVLLLMLL